MELPKDYDSKTSEKKWQEYWEKEEIYRFDKDDTKRELYTIDTPPPTVSGQMHLGHSFSYSQQDFVARYQRMRGKNVFYPYGTDDNGLATERLIEKMKNVRSVKMKRSEFIKLCLDTLDEIRPAFVQDWKNIGMSCDFSLFYSTINDHCRKISQKSFLDLYKAGREYRKEAPMMICPLCRTAIAQVEMEDKELESYLCYIRVKAETGEELVFATTRPELFPACVGISVHPDDKRYKHLIGKQIKLPLINRSVPLTADIATDMEYGSGVVYYCTYGGVDCIEWLERHKEVEPIHIMGLDGIYNEKAGKYKGMNSHDARLAVIEDLEKASAIVKLEKIKHNVNVHERCGTEIEYVATKQWFIRYLDLKDDFLKAGSELTWYPPFMKNRLDNWIKGLKWDWCISRQRHFGVCFPVWYCKNCDHEILADENSLPVDPMEDASPVRHCPKCKGQEFIGEKDVLDTWATSSLTPLLAGELIKGSLNYEHIYPMDLRPQAHDIITFWLFNTLVKNQLHFQKNPWKSVMISGWALDPHGKKMSKSKGNVIAPQEMIEKYSADALRFWAAGSKLGDDLPFQEKDLVTGKKMATKMWNASKFAIMHLENFKYDTYELETMDKWLLTKLQKVIKNCTESMDAYEYSKAKQELELFFWNVFCDNYLEIVKDRLYNPDKYITTKKLSAQLALYESTLNILKLAAPIMPYITEEIYHLYFSSKEKKKSIHVSAWPQYNSSLLDEEAENAGDYLVRILSAVRKFKSEKGMSLKQELKSVVIECSPPVRELIEKVYDDLKAVTLAKDIEFETADPDIDTEIRIQISL